MSFASFPIETLAIPPNLRDAALRADLTTLKILTYTLPRLADALKCKPPFAQDLVKAVARAVAPKSETALSIYKSENPTLASNLGSSDRSGRGKWLSTGDTGFDECLGGGLRRGSLYEITGESASGKSHLILSLAIAAQLSSCSSSPGSSVVLTSERDLSTDRLVELSRFLIAAHEPCAHPNTLAADKAMNKRVKEITDNVLSNRVGDVDALEHTLSYVIPPLLESRIIASSRPSASGNPSAIPVRLLVLDSLTALLRGGSTAPSDKPTAPSSLSLTERSKHLCIVTDLLKALAVKYDLAVVVINQVSDVFIRNPSNTPPSGNHGTPVTGEPPSSGWNQTQPFGPGMTASFSSDSEPPMTYARQSRWFSGQTEVLQKEASLGLVWANGVNVRVMLSRTGRRRMLYQSDLRPAKRRRGGDDEDVEDGQAGAGVEVDKAEPTLIRRLHVVFSPFSQSATIDYAITPSGVHSLPGSYQKIDPVANMRKKWGYGDVPASQGTLGSVEVLDGGTVESEADAVWDCDEVYDDFGELPAEFWDGVLAGENQASGQGQLG
ncbi:hypothetical protein B9479_005088 [Cryptococcus floricola]|uniref:RecA family profile 1 domain-containing protein n=1 Tax=Cryptococcus floricola TaxID=2591691 RepID=A0A5D3AUD9_9TREE|nr:hypothetical protein B9479_005088 [Cryptococcus floricola]